MNGEWRERDDVRRSPDGKCSDQVGGACSTHVRDEISAYRTAVGNPKRKSYL